MTFTVTASTTEEAKAALERIAATLGTPKPERHVYWRELGFEGWCEAYMEDLYTPEALELKERLVLFGKGDVDPGPAPPPDIPMGTRIAPGRVARGGVGHPASIDRIADKVLSRKPDAGKTRFAYLLCASS